MESWDNFYIMIGVCLTNNFTPSKQGTTLLLLPVDFCIFKIFEKQFLGDHENMKKEESQPSGWRRLPEFSTGQNTVNCGILYSVFPQLFRLTLFVEVIVANVWIPFTNAWDFQLCRDLTYWVGDFGMDILFSTCVLSDCDLYLTPGFGLSIPLRFLLQISGDWFSGHDRPFLTDL